ncbi:MAG: hydrogenase maturation nickel metallochaperone HypA [Candidatus Hydrogenedentes bacterium]|nr:hydrogenase maturation nickel metallochaperone HypA [Candidatus Hydrogenedentota bacterium]
MHEFSLAKSILDCALELSEAHGGAPVERIEVEIGALQAVIPESLKFAFEAAVADTAAAGAVLDWREIPALVSCPACEKNYEPDDLIWSCPDCSATGGRAIHGDELIITRVVLSDLAQTHEPISSS